MTGQQVVQSSHEAEPSREEDQQTKRYGRAHASRPPASAQSDGSPEGRQPDCVVLLQAQKTGAPGLSLPEIISIYGEDVSYVLQGVRDPQTDRFTARRVDPNDLWLDQRNGNGTASSPAAQGDPSLWHLANARFDGVQQSLVNENGAHVQLTSYEARILALLLRHRGKDVSRDRISELVFSRRWNPEDRSIDVHIARLRRKMKEAGLAPHLIQTVRGKGYCLAAGES